MKNQFLKPALIVLASILVIWFFFLKDKQKTAPDQPTEITEETVEPVGRPEPSVTTTSLPQTAQVTPSNEVLKSFVATLSKDIADCFAFPHAGPLALKSPSGQELVNSLEEVFGAVLEQQEVWTDWRIQLPSGQVREYRLENREVDDGVRVRSLYSLPTPDTVEEAPVFLDNPTDNQIEEVLSNGTVQNKEKLFYANFRNGERVEWRDRNDRTVEFEIVREEKIFRCSTFEQRESCQCIK